MEAAEQSMPEVTVLRRLAIQEALSYLSNKHQVVMRLLGEGNSKQEIADMLGIPVGTVKSRAHYARGIIKAAIADGRITP